VKRTSGLSPRNFPNDGEEKAPRREKRLVFLEKKRPKQSLAASLKLSGIICFLLSLLPQGGLSGQTPASPAVQTQTEVPIILTPTPTGTPHPSRETTPGQGPLGHFTPAPGEKFKLEDWVEHSVPSAVPKEKSLTKPGVWLSAISVGAGIPQSPNLREAYATGFHLGLGVGLRVAAPLSLWLDCDIDQFNNKNSNLTRDNNYMLVGFAGLARWRFLACDFSPFLFLGPGLAYNENRSTNAVVDATYDTVTLPISGSEFDFLMEGGWGVSYAALDGLEIFLQGRLLWDSTSPHFARIGYTDSPVMLTPVEGGAVLYY
jgi:hypothetical protein